MQTAHAWCCLVSHEGGSRAGPGWPTVRGGGGGRLPGLGTFQWVLCPAPREHAPEKRLRGCQHMEGSVPEAEPQAPVVGAASHAAAQQRLLRLPPQGSERGFSSRLRAQGGNQAAGSSRGAPERR